MNRRLDPTHSHSHLWYPVSAGGGRGTVLLLHGLNQNPLSWKDMIDFLGTKGFGVMCVRLSGHRGLPFSDMKNVSVAGWLDEVTAAYRAARDLNGSGPMYCLAYSLGGLLSALLQQRAGRPLFARQVYLAPALVPKLYTRMVLPIIKLFPLLPSKSVKSYAANREGTSAAAYHALFEMNKLVKMHDDISLLNIPTKVLMHPKDELISFSGTSRFIARNEFSNWSLVPLRKDSGRSTTGATVFRHLVIDNESLGPQSWHFLTKEICEHFTAEPVSNPSG